jgi:hypothetical protein
LAARTLPAEVGMLVGPFLVVDLGESLRCWAVKQLYRDAEGEGPAKFLPPAVRLPDFAQQGALAH